MSESRTREAQLADERREFAQEQRKTLEGLAFDAPAIKLLFDGVRVTGAVATGCFIRSVELNVKEPIGYLLYLLGLRNLVQIRQELDEAGIDHAVLGSDLRTVKLRIETASTVLKHQLGKDAAAVTAQGQFSLNDLMARFPPEHDRA